MEPTTWSIPRFSPLFESFILSHNLPSIPPRDTARNLTELMMDMTDGVGCAENEHFSLSPQNAFCCEMDRRDLRVKYAKVKKLSSAPNVCKSGPNSGNKMSPIPGCMCNEGLELNVRTKSLFGA